MSNDDPLNRLGTCNILHYGMAPNQVVVVIPGELQETINGHQQKSKKFWDAMKELEDLMQGD